MAPRNVVVDGSNLATEGRSTPSLSQLDQAVREFVSENPNDIVTVVVDASFSHRIDPSEQKQFDEAEAAGEVVSPPAGAIGRGDAFLLRIADKTAGTVLSNDSFQENTCKLRHEEVRSSQVIAGLDQELRSLAFGFRLRSTRTSSLALVK